MHIAYVGGDNTKNVPLGGRVLTGRIVNMLDGIRSGSQPKSRRQMRRLLEIAMRIIETGKPVRVGVYVDGALYRPRLMS